MDVGWMAIYKHIEVDIGRCHAGYSGRELEFYIHLNLLMDPFTDLSISFPRNIYSLCWNIWDKEIWQAK